MADKLEDNLAYQTVAAVVDNPLVVEAENPLVVVEDSQALIAAVEDIRALLVEEGSLASVVAVDNPLAAELAFRNQLEADSQASVGLDQIQAWLAGSLGWVESIIEFTLSVFGR